MEKNGFPRLEISDYRVFLKHYDRCRIRKIEVSGPDIASILLTIRDETARIAQPDAVLLSVGVSPADDISVGDMALLLKCVAGDKNPNVCWGIREHTGVLTIQIVIYVGTSGK